MKSDGFTISMVSKVRKTAAFVNTFITSRFPAASRRLTNSGLKNNGQKFHDPFDMFSQFGGGFGHQERGERRGPDINLHVDTTLVELYNGRSIDIEVNKHIICPVCRGNGARSDEDIHTCKSCNGNGVKIVKVQIAPGFFQQMQQPYIELI
jgi:DnaJ-class molecular chaperone